MLEILHCIYVGTWNPTWVLHGLRDIGFIGFGIYILGAEVHLKLMPQDPALLPAPAMLQNHGSFV